MKAQPLDLSIALGEYAHQIICQNFQRFVEREESVLKDRDPEPLHQMRVGMRQLRTAVRVFGAAIVLPKGVSNSSIGAIAKSLGETRDLDVLQLELTNRYQLLLPNPEQSKFNKVLKHLHQNRDQSFLNLKKTLNSDRYQKLKRSIQAWIEKPTYTPVGNLSILEILPDLLLPLICELFLHPGWLVGTRNQAGKVASIPIENVEELNRQLSQFGDLLHSLRKQIKGVRYQAEFFAAFYEPSYMQRIAEFKAIQEILGQFQDRVVLRQFLESALNANLEKVLPTIEREIQQDDLAFWQNWQPLQQSYLSLEFRESLRSLLTKPLNSAPTVSPKSKKKAKGSPSIPR
ncbi:CHAD domain-containing protein [Tumidithrix elongata RA019]|uniref:CHAD domain-containing protein n=1 Tax=Tumidithrix elongata BACA0141 TaxID=2716417 RepID=A0AAW9PUH3_9CYAN|nr:CHAD domain-containing protein [Tumidithrix elongata RA019]